MAQRLKRLFQDFLKSAVEDMQADLREGLLQELARSQMAGLMGIQGTGEFDPYAVLGLERDCSEDEVKRRYLELMKLLHPDVAGGKTTFLATLVNLAYQNICRERNLS